MRFAVAAMVVIIAGAGTPARADGVQSAYAAIGNWLQIQFGGGLVPFAASCPKGINNPWRYVISAVLVPVSQTKSAVLVNTRDCGGGNEAGQYLVMSESGIARVVTDAGIGDGSFLATNMYFKDDTLTLYGYRWLPSDPHCCPSRKANLEFNLKTGDRRLTIQNGSN